MKDNFLHLAYDAFKRLTHVTGQLIGQPRRDLQRSVDVLCKTIAFGHHENNAMHSTTYNTLQRMMEEVMLLGNDNISTWSGFANTLSESCSKFQEYYKVDADVIKQISSISSNIRGIVSPNPELEGCVVDLVNNSLHSAGFYTFIKQSNTPFMLGRMMYPKENKRLAYQA